MVVDLVFVVKHTFSLADSSFDGQPGASVLPNNVVEIDTMEREPFVDNFDGVLMGGDDRLYFFLGQVLAIPKLLDNAQRIRIQPTVHASGR